MGILTCYQNRERAFKATLKERYSSLINWRQKERHKHVLTTPLYPEPSRMPFEKNVDKRWPCLWLRDKLIETDQMPSVQWCGSERSRSHSTVVRKGYSMIPTIECVFDSIFCSELEVPSVCFFSLSVVCEWVLFYSNSGWWEIWMNKPFHRKINFECHKWSICRMCVCRCRITWTRDKSKIIPHQL